MIDDDSIENEIRTHILGLMYVLYEHGIREVHMGGLMRLLGVPNDIAQSHDNNLVKIDADFAKYMSDMQSPRDSSQFLH